jgi:pyridoxine 4-dehydrogenase
MAAQIGTHSVHRVGYGAMQLDHQVSDEDAAAVLRRAIDLGVNHIDTASFYGAGEVNRRIRSALAPYPDDLLIVSKVGAAPAAGPIPLQPAQKPAQLRAEVEANLTELGLESIPVVNLRRLDLGPGLTAEGDQVVSLDDQLAEMIALRDEGKIGGIGLSAVDTEGVRAALGAGIVCVQNAYSVLDRAQEATLDLCAAHDIAWVPFFPLGSAFAGFPSVTDHPEVQAVAAEVDATAAQVGLAWLLAHSPHTLLIPGTRSVRHLEENVAAAQVSLPADALARLDAVGSSLSQPHGAEGFTAR